MASIPANSRDYRRSFIVESQTYYYYDISAVGIDKISFLPYSIRVLLECALRNLDNCHVVIADVENIVEWSSQCLKPDGVEIPFKPARVLHQDFTGIPALVDFASMRDAVFHLGGDPEKIQPHCQVDFVIDHSIQVDIAGCDEALELNQTMEFERYTERFRFLKWCSKAFKKFFVMPPGSGIMHQINLEYLAKVVFENDLSELYPDSLMGTDSHTTMINGLGILGWGLGGMEADACMLGDPIRMLLPQVLGYKLTGTLSALATSTDVVLTIVSHLRRVGVVGKFVEFFGPGLAHLSIPDRATIANMCPEYGATCGFFPVDQASLAYLRQTGRDPHQLDIIEQYLRTNYMLREESNQDVTFSSVVELDLSSVVPSVAGPKRPHDHVPLAHMKADFLACLSNKIGFKGFGLSTERLKDEIEITLKSGVNQTLHHGDVLIAAIASSTNTSNPSVMIGAGLLAKKAVEAGLSVKPVVKTSLSPGSVVVTAYLERSGLMPYLQQLGFYNVGYGCMTCIGNSGPLEEAIAAGIEAKDLVVAGVLSGNRNFEGRIHPSTRANYLASPPLVVAYALAGTVVIDFETEPLGIGHGGQPVFLRDVWPTKQEISELEATHVIPHIFTEVYSRVKQGTTKWNQLEAPSSTLFPWNESSTYIQRSPFFETMEREIALTSFSNPVCNARVLLNLGDSVATDLISPAGGIRKDSAAARFLSERGIKPQDYNSYGSRRGHVSIMARGTFANIRLVNKLVNKTGPHTIHLLSGQEMSIFDASELYRKSETPVIILAGKEYGSGSSRDSAAKGPWMLGVRAILAESFERIHRSNLVCVGIIPLQYLQGDSALKLGLTGHEVFTLELDSQLQPGSKLWMCAAQPESENSAGNAAAERKRFQVICRFDTKIELEYYRHGGILQYLIRKMMH